MKIRIRRRSFELVLKEIFSYYNKDFKNKIIRNIIFVVVVIVFVYFLIWRLKIVYFFLIQTLIE